MVPMVVYVPMLVGMPDRMSRLDSFSIAKSITESRCAREMGGFDIGHLQIQQMPRSLPREKLA